MRYVLSFRLFEITCRERHRYTSRAHVELRHTNIQLKNSFDLELNPFERSFAPTDNHIRAGAAPQAPTGMAPGEPPLPNGQKPKNIEKTEGTPTLLASSKLEHAPSAQSTATLALPAPDQSENKEPGSAGSNKHNLRLLNFQSVAASENRLPGLTPPIFTPGGRRLPPIHLSPNAAMGTPETPGSSLWSSLLNATNGQGGHEGQQGLNLNYAQFANMMRKLGLTPNELNLRLGFTPGVGQQTFNFGHIPGLTPGGLSNGQMTPGLLSFLGLSHQGNQEGPSSQTQPVHLNHAPVRQTQLYQPPSQSRPAPVPAPQPSASAPAAGAAPSASTEPEPTFAIPTEPPRPMPVVKQEEDTKVKEPPAKKAKANPRAKKEKKKEEKKKKAPTPVDEEEEKRKQFLERNRVAASKCRQRKKQLFQKMEDELAFYSTGYRELSAQVTQLREQLLTLRSVVTSLKNLPVLINAVGGYQQLQNIIGQTDYIAQAAVNSQPNFHLIPSTIPTTLNASQQPLQQLSPQSNKAGMKYMGPQGQAGPEEQPHIQGDRRRLVQGSNGLMSYQDPNGGQNVTIPAEAPVEEVPRHFSGEMNGMANMQPVDQSGLRNLSSTSNLQNKQMEQGYQGLRNVASMANLQH